MGLPQTYTPPPSLFTATNVSSSGHFSFLHSALALCFLCPNTKLLFSAPTPLFPLYSLGPPYHDKQSYLHTQPFHGAPPPPAGPTEPWGSPRQPSRVNTTLSPTYDECPTCAHAHAHTRVKEKAGGTLFILRNAVSRPSYHKSSSLLPPPPDVTYSRSTGSPFVFILTSKIIRNPKNLLLFQKSKHFSFKKCEKRITLE